MVRPGRCRANQAIRAAVADPRVSVELDRFNLELNATPVLLAGRPFAALGGELNVLLDRVADAATDLAGRPALIGILPTLRPADLGPGVMTDVPRYRALSSGLRQAPPGPVPYPDRRRRPARAGQRRCRAGGGEQLVPDPPSRRSGRLHPHLQRGPAGHGARAGRVRQLAHLPWPPAVGGDPDRCVQAVGRRSPGSLGPRRRLARTALGTGWLRGGALELFTESVRLHQPLLPVLSAPGPAWAWRRPVAGAPAA